MSDLNSQQKSYLEELFRITGGDPTVQASMHDVGEAIGLDREAAGKLAEELIAQGYLEIRTLSGGVGITQLGIDSGKAGNEATDSADWRLGGTPILDEKDRKAVEAALEAIKNAVGRNNVTYPQMETVVMDIKTIEIQMLSPQPKTAVVREVFLSLQQTLDAMNMTDQASAIQKMLAT
ncbi:MAG: hypothetical protein PVG41_14300 [Desulfobacteraceae bacterium]|jgi:hypothetical protein